MIRQEEEEKEGTGRLKMSQGASHLQQFVSEAFGTD